MTRTERAAYAQGKRDAKAGRSLHAPRYKDLAQDRAWFNGMLAAVSVRIAPLRKARGK